MDIGRSQKMNNPNPRLTKSSHHLTHTLMLIAIAVIGTWAINALPLVPPWETHKLPVMTAIDMLVLTIIGWRIIGSRHYRRKPAMIADVVFACCAIVTLWLILFEASDGILGGENIEIALRDNNSGDELFIYSLDEFPDGFIATRVAVRIGWLPFERTLLQIETPFAQSKQTPSGLILLFGLEKYSYRYANGQLTPVNKQR